MIPQTGIGRFLFFLHIALIAAQWLVPLAAMSSLPEEIPIHFDFSGNPDGYGARATLWLLPVIATFLGFLAIVLLQYPSSFNVPGRADIAALPEKQRLPIHDLMREMLLAIFVVVQVICLSVTGLIIASVHAENFAFPTNLILSFVVAPLAVVIMYLVRVSRALDRAKREAGHL